MNRHTVIGLVIGLVVGVFIGYEAGSSGPSPAPVGAMPAGMPGVPQQMPPQPDTENRQARIATLQSVVARDPKNLQAWIQLGNDYFDTRQPQKAIEAYGRALELKPDDPNVLTDQGVMYRDLGQYDKAIANFQRAAKADPKHIQSLFNMGVVYANDLKQPQKAVEAWKKVVEIAPASPQAADARKAIDETRLAK